MSKAHPTSTHRLVPNEDHIMGPFYEAPSQGGEVYWRCRDCGREVVETPANLLHTKDCPHRDGDG